MTVKQQVELTGDYFRRSASRIQIQVSIALGGGQLGLAQEAGQHREAQTEAHCGAGVGVAQVMDSHVR